jgi:hypothetical protein
VTMRPILFATFLLSALALLAAQPVPAPALSGSPDDAEARAVTAVLKRGMAEWRTNFTAIRGKRIDSSRYLPTVDLSPKYLDCTIRDLSDGSVPNLAELMEMLHEQAYIRWELHCQSRQHSMAFAPLADWLQPVVAPNLPGTLSHVTQNAPKGRSVLWGDQKSGPLDVTMIVNEADNQRSSYELGVEHVVKTAHASPPPALGTTDTRPVTAQTKKEAKAIADFVRLGLLEAPTDFEKIRGKLLNPGEESVDNPQYAAAVPFASAFHACTIELTGLWDFACTSNALSDASFEAVVAFVKQAVSADLPPGFVFQPTPGDRGELNWRGPHELWVHAKTTAEELRPYRPSYQVSVNKRSP